MDAIALEWGGLLLRWTHIITGIAWIGSSFYFMHLDAALRAIPEIPAGKGGEAWEVHGGGFYQVRKYLVAPDRMPAELMWHKWESYSTWISGFSLLVWVYYLSADLYLIDPSIRALTPWQAAAIGVGGLALGWFVYDFLCKSPLANNEVALAAIGFAFVMAMAFFFQQMFSGRGALLHTGALMGTIMTGNVFMNIIPNTKIVVADLIAGRKPDPKYGKQAKTRSTHNNYLTLPVLFLMISGHYPMTFMSPYAWLMVGFVLIAGAHVRYFYNQRHAGKGDKWWAWGVAAISILVAVWLSMLSNPLGRQKLGMPALTTPAVAAVRAHVPKDVEEVLTSRCAMCHAAEPAWAGLAAPPKGVLLDTPANIAGNAELVRVQAVLTSAMPPNNITEMTREERIVLAKWLAAK
ncbi:MAG: urate hydroxylase PuuD [Methylobacteriaceae bacterium]|nr:urate hydroxylase PuuD [Hyphomicrobiales bacterium]MCO5088320.1 urate hydroxylase PuuD [Methylobacteriaceae bacterium]